MAGRGGDRSVKAKANGKRVGRPQKTPVPKVRRDVAYEVVDFLNARFDDEKAQTRAEKKLSGEAKIVVDLLAADKRLKWDVYRYIKECVDGKPMVRQEETIVFDPNQPLRVVVEHIGSVRAADSAAAETS